MTPEDRLRVRDLFEAALEIPTGERAAWVDRQEGDSAVRAEVRSLLDYESRAGVFLESPVLDRVPGLLMDDGRAPGMNDELAPGSEVGPYTIVREIGRGGMGVVYKASDRRLGRTVALKVLAPALARDAGQRERLRREARAAAGLTHPGICTVYALEEIDGGLYIATEFLEGRTLREEMGTGHLPASADLLRTALDLASALASAHERGITHRDLKPENVMRTHDGRLKILDFGLARIDGPALELPVAWATAPGMLLGTPAYMAPEQLNGQGVDRRADVFALGVVLYEYACGVHPFAAETPLATIARVLESEAGPLSARSPQVPAALVQIIDRCLSKSPADRYQSAGEVVAALERAGQSGVAPAVPPRWWRVHQVVVIVLYLSAASLGWVLKEWLQTPVTVSLFVALGIGATIGCVLRFHMLFTERMNRPMLAAERRRTARGLMAVDIAVAAALIADGVLFAAQPLTAVLTIALALGIALAAIVLEPTTTLATFGENS